MNRRKFLGLLMGMAGVVPILKGLSCVGYQQCGIVSSSKFGGSVGYRGMKFTGQYLMGRPIYTVERIENEPYTLTLLPFGKGDK